MSHTENHHSADNAELEAFAHQYIALDGTPNCRDLGGYLKKDKAGNAQRVKSNAFLRSGELSSLTESDWLKLAGKNLKYICDFRRPDERANSPTTLPTDGLIDILDLSIAPGNHSSFLKDILLNTDLTADLSRESMREINRCLVLDNKETYKAFLNTAFNLEANESMLFHCSAGKDRTGFGAALILMCLDFDRKTIMNDYMVTRQYFRAKDQLVSLMNRWAGNTKDKQQQVKKLNLEALTPLMDIEPSYLQAAFDAIDGEFGDSDTYLREFYGISTKDKQEFQQRFLTD